MSFDYIIFASYGNDSIALMQFAHEKNLKNVAVIYSDTGWSSPLWHERICCGEELAEYYGFTPIRIKSEGMEALVKRKKGWPMGGGAAFCTAELKVKPAAFWLDQVDPNGDATCMVGVRREESANRAQHPEWVDSSDNHGGRELWSPLVRHKEKERNELIARAGFDVLAHRSSECFPCVHANISDLRQLDEESIARVERIEKEMGINSKGNPRVLFRPKRHKGATGIREVIAWAKIIRPNRDQMDLFKPCNSGYCGS